MANSFEVAGLIVSEELYRLVRDEIAPDTGVEADAFWSALSRIVKELGPKNRMLLDKRNGLQKRVDEWCLARRGSGGLQGFPH
jgi:malate synthase